MGFFIRYQPLFYRLDGPMGTREDLRDLIQTCRGFGVRVYIDAGNDLYKHRYPAGCATWGNKTSSAPYESNINTNLDPSNEFPGAAIGTDDFHCNRALNAWTDLFNLNNGWLVG